MTQKPSTSSPLSFETLWSELPQHWANHKLPDGMEERLLQRFEFELGAEEQRRQRRALEAKMPTPATNSSWWSRIHWAWYGLWASATAACLLVIGTWYPSSVPVVRPYPTPSLSRSFPVTDAFPQTNATASATKLSTATQVPQSLPKTGPTPEQAPTFYQDLQLYEKMEILEKMKVLEQLPTLTKGS